jgi:RimJ/RimL family protein N-acetyltransferase
MTALTPPNADPGELLIAEWTVQGALFRVVEPRSAELGLHTTDLAAYYNEPDNRRLMTNEHEFSAEAVAHHFAELRAEGGRPFLLFEDDLLMGDCDLRNIEAGQAEFAILVGARARQGQGKGTLFSVMVHALAFGRLALRTVYASVRPENVGSLRMLQKVGYAVDASPEARRYAEADDDVCLSVSADAFAAGVAGELATRSIRVAVRA